MFLYSCIQTFPLTSRVSFLLIIDLSVYLWILSLYLKTVDLQCRSCALVSAFLTQLYQIVDSQQDLHLSGKRLNGGGSILLINTWEVPGTLVACLQPPIHQHFTRVPA